MRRCILGLGLLLMGLLLAACGGNTPGEPAAGGSTESPLVTVYKPPT